MSVYLCIHPSPLASWQALRPLWQALRPLWQALTPLGQALRPLRQALRPLWQALRPLWQALNSHRMDRQTDVWTCGISPHSTGLCPLSGPLPCYLLETLQNQSRAREPLTS